MGRKRKEYGSDSELLKRYLKRAYARELAGQTKLPHYHATKSQMISCLVCDATDCKLHRHRVMPLGEYVDTNIVIVCVPCHKLIHRIYNETNASNEHQYRLAILQARFEVAGE